MSTRSGLVRQSIIDPGSPPRTRKGVSPTRSPARMTRSSPSARSSIQKSPSRKSPNRKSPTRKSPTRRAPGRKTTPKNSAPKSPSRPSKDSLTNVQFSPSKRRALKTDVSLKLLDVTANLDFYRSTRSRGVEYFSKDLQSNISKPELSIADKVIGFESQLTTVNNHDIRYRKPLEEIPPRRSSMLQDFVDNGKINRRSTSKTVSEPNSVRKSISKSMGTISDEENSEDDRPREKSVSLTRRLATPLRSSIGKVAPSNNTFEFGGKYGPILLMILMPFTVFSLLISCAKLCSYKQLDLFPFKAVKVWLNYEALTLIATQYIVQAIFLIIPIFGIRQENGKGRKQCFNASVASIFTVIMLFAFDYYKTVCVDSILGSYLSLALTAYLFGVLLAIILYIKRYKLDGEGINRYGQTGYYINDFFAGHEIHPYIKSLNVKLWISRISNINALVLLILIFKNGFELPIKDVELSLENYKEFISKVNFKPTILLYSIMQIIYILKFIMEEHKITSTFYWQSEGVGYLQTISSALYPFYFTSVSKYVLDADLNMSTNALIAAVALFLVGFMVMLASNNIKHEFRKNPYQMNLARLNSMPTFHGNKLLIANLWGIVRHPNYTGDILLHIAFALPGILTMKPIATLPAVLTIVFLLHRARRDHIRCCRKYGAAWQRYCKRVPSVIIPKVL